MEAVLKEHNLLPSDVLGVSARIEALRTAFRAAKTAEEQDKIIRDAGVVDSLPVSKEYETTPASFFGIDPLKISEACKRFCDFITTYALDINALGLGAPADESAWKHTVSIGNRHLAAHKMDECGELGPKLVEGRTFVHSTKPEESKTVAVVGRPRLHGYESKKSAPNGEAPRDRIHAHLDGNNVKGEIFNEVRIRNEAISLSTLGSLGMSARHVGLTELKDTDAFARGPFTMFTMTRPARERVKHAVVADHDSRAGGISVVAKIYHDDYDWIFACARRLLFADFLEVIAHACQMVAKSLLEADDKVALNPLIFVPAPSNLKNLKSDAQRLTSVYAGLANRDRRLGIHAIDEDGIHFNAVKGGLAAYRAKVGIFGLDDETRRENSVKGGLASRDAKVGIHGLDEETRRENSVKGGLASRDAKVGIHGLDEETRRENSVKGGLVGGVASRDAKVGIHGLDEETRRENSIKGGLVGGVASRDAKVGIHGLDEETRRENSVKGGLVGGVASRDAKVGIHGLDEETRRENSIKGGLASRDAKFGIHGLDEETRRENSVKGGLASRDAKVGIHGLDEETRRENSIKGGLASRDAKFGIHGLDEETRRENSVKGGLASRDAKFGIHGLDEETRRENSVKGGLASRDAKFGIHGLDEETRRENSVKGGCAVRDAQKGIHEVDEHGIKFQAVRGGQIGGKIGGPVTKAKGVGIFGRTAEQHSADSKLAGARGSASLHQRFTAANAHRVRQFSILGKKNADDDDSIEEYVLEAITMKKAHNGEEAWRLRMQQSTFEALRRAIQTHVDNENDRKLLESSVKPGGRSGKSSFCNIAIPGDNATSWNAQDYRNTKTFAKQYRFFFDLLRYVVIVESEDDAYVAADDEHPLEEAAA